MPTFKSNHVDSFFLLLNEINASKATVVKSDLRAPFFITTIPRCRLGPNPFSGLTHFTLDPYL